MRQFHKHLFSLRHKINTESGDKGNKIIISGKTCEG
jgi:hypothetical protein